MGTWNSWEREEKLIEAVKTATSIAGVCRLLGLKPVGGNIATIKHHVTRLDLDTSHHLGQAWNRGNYAKPAPNNTKQTIKKGLIREYGHKCWSCGLTEWMGEPIPLEMDHINGINSDNRIENLRILCCNCHAQTPTFRNRKRDPAGVVELVYTEDLSPSDESHARSNRVTRTYCVICNKPCRQDLYWHAKCMTCCDCGKRSTALRCKSCAGKAREGTKIDWPPLDELLDRLSKSNYTRLAAELGVSDNAVRKHIKRMVT